jgi:hypothetical protein
MQDFNERSKQFGRSEFEDPERTLSKYGVDTITVYYRVEVPPMLRQLLSFMSGPIIPPTIAK